MGPTTVKRVVICCIFVLALSSLWGCGLFNHQKRPSLHVEETGCAPVNVPDPCSKQEVAEAIPPEPPKPEQKLPMNAKKSKRGELYRSNERVYYPLLGKQGYEETGVASWYGPSFHGRKTSSGEVFDMHKISAAHKILPMHAQVTVTNLENGRSTTLTVNDRGPFVAGRVLDLSYAAAKNLDMVDRGLARVLIRTSAPVPGQKHDDITGEFFVHVGSFEAEEVATRLLEDMKSLNYKHSMVKVIRADRDGDIHWRVELGPYRSMSHANKAHSTVVKDYPSAFVVASQ
jgi:rare lipoprotein A